MAREDADRASLETNPSITVSAEFTAALIRFCKMMGMDKTHMFL